MFMPYIRESFIVKHLTDNKRGFTPNRTQKTVDDLLIISLHGRNHYI